MKSRISDETRLKHIMECIQEIERAIVGMDMDSFCYNHVTRMAVVKWIEIIGEAANHITEETQSLYVNVEWRKIVGLRNIIVHEYFGVNYEVIWNVAINFIAELKKELTTINLDLNDNFLTN